MRPRPPPRTSTVNPDLTFFTGWADGDESYPIAAQTWIIVYKNQTDKAKGEATKAWINYVLTDGQDAANAVDFAAAAGRPQAAGDRSARPDRDPLLSRSPRALTVRAPQALTAAFATVLQRR